MSEDEKDKKIKELEVKLNSEKKAKEMREWAVRFVLPLGVAGVLITLLLINILTSKP